jgi:pyruvate formate lyase activating enzyme
MISRRDFLLATAGIGPLAGSSVPPGGLASASAPAQRSRDLIKSAPKARYWISSTSAGVDCRNCHTGDESTKPSKHGTQPGIVKCLLCAQGCILHPDERGRCRARINVNGEMRSLVYGHPVTIHIDPIEKKPFYHFLPGSSAFSLATSGCPLHCKFCQNWEISQASPEDFKTEFVSPRAVTAAAAERRAPVIAFTYNEPTVFTEYLTDIARAAREQKIRCVLVSCGFMNPEPLDEMCGLLAAIKIDLKGFSEDFYRKVCGAELQPVLRSLRHIGKSKVHLEIVNLVVPTLNDSEKMMQSLSEWVVGELGRDVPIHFTRFHPDYQLLNLPPTPVETLERAREIAMARGVHFAYVGNVPDHPGNHTYCPHCGRVVIRRNSFFVLEMNLSGGNCKFCGKPLAGVWS